jgi:hypothetical protein
MAGNSSFDGLVAFASERQMKTEWSRIWTTDWPLLVKVLNDTLAGRRSMGTNAKFGPDGNSVLFPLEYLGPATSARAATKANAATAITPTLTQGFTQAQYHYAKYENAFWLTSHERELIARSPGGTTRIPILSGKVDQLQSDFKNIVSTDFLGTQNGTGYEGNGQITGERYFLSTSNSPGGVSQTTYTTWAADVVSSAGQMYEGLLDAPIHRINTLGRGPADFAQLSWSSTNDVYGKVYGLIAPAQVIVDQGKSVEYGFEVFKYRNLDCFQDNKLGDAVAGSMVIGRSGSWHAFMKSQLPQLSNVDGTKRISGTSLIEYFYEWWIAWANDDVASNTYVTGIL